MKFATETLATSFRRGETGAGHFRRFKGWDYSNGASFFITLALEDRRPLFGRVEGGAMVLSPLGEEVLAALQAIPRIHPEITLYGHVVMPDHVHFNCHLAAGLENPIKVLGRAISGFKAVTTRSPHAQCACGSTPGFGHAPGCCAGSTPDPHAQCARGSTPAFWHAPDCCAGSAPDPHAQCARGSTPGFGHAPDCCAGSAPDPHARCACGSTPVSGQALRETEAEQFQSSPGARSGGASAPRLRIWRLGYHDHLCLSRSFIDSTERYIAYNPLKWELMHGAGSLRILEPLFSPRLDPADYWKGVGNPALLSAGSKLVSLRVSREVRDIASVVSRMEQAADQGFAIASGFVSPGEQAVRDALCRRPGARLVHVRASCIPNARFKPESAYVQPFAEGRCLEIGKGNEEIEFGRAACLDVNAEIAEMAKAGPGYALYFKREGLVRL